MSVQFTKRRRAAIAGLSLLALTLAACSGGGGSEDQQGKPLPTITGNPAVTLDVFAPQSADWNLAVVRPRRSGRSRWPAVTIRTCIC